MRFLYFDAGPMATPETESVEIAAADLIEQSESGVDQPKVERGAQHPGEDWLDNADADKRGEGDETGAARATPLRASILLHGIMFAESLTA